MHVINNPNVPICMLRILIDDADPVINFCANIKLNKLIKID